MKSWVLTAGCRHDFEIVAAIVGTEDEASEAAKAIYFRRLKIDEIPSHMKFVTYEPVPTVNKRGEVI